MNWIEIDRVLRNMVSIYKDRAKLYADVKKKFAWNNNQAKAALDPIVNKMDAVVAVSYTHLTLPTTPYV